MIQFILCEDNLEILNNNHKIINNIMINYDDDYEILEFSEYNKELKEIIHRREHRKIYVLDVEIPNKTGVEIAREIREDDWNSSIIILTAHYEIAFDVFKKRLMLLDFISKFSEYEKSLELALKDALKVGNKRNVLKFEINRIPYRIIYDNIITIEKDTVDRKTIIKTNYSEFALNKSIKEVKELLDERFIQVHRSMIINKDYIENYDPKEKKIYLKNKRVTDLISRNLKGELDEFIGVE